MGTHIWGALQDIYKKLIGQTSDTYDWLNIYNVGTHLYIKMDVHAYTCM